MRRIVTRGLLCALLAVPGRGLACPPSGAPVIRVGLVDVAPSGFGHVVLETPPDLLHTGFWAAALVAAVLVPLWWLVPSRSSAPEEGPWGLRWRPVPSRGGGRACAAGLIVWVALVGATYGPRRTVLDAYWTQEEPITCARATRMSLSPSVQRIVDRRCGTLRYPAALGMIFLFAGLALGGLASRGLRRCRPTLLEIDAHGVRVSGAYSSRRVPWSDVQQIRLDVRDLGPWHEMDLTFVLEDQPSLVLAVENGTEPDVCHVRGVAEAALVRWREGARGEAPDRDWMEDISRLRRLQSRRRRLTANKTKKPAAARGAPDGEDVQPQPRRSSPSQS